MQRVPPGRQRRSAGQQRRQNDLIHDEVAVIAHTGKTIGGGLEELRVTLAKAGIADPLWSEVPKSRYAPERVQRALSEGVELVFVWGGDGMVNDRSIDWPAAARPSRSFRLGRPTSSPPALRSHPTSKKPCTLA